MCEHCLTRRTFVGRGLGAAAGFAVGAGPLSAMNAPGALRIGSGSAESPLDRAIECWRWIDAARVTTGGGITWLADPSDATSVGSSLYTHGPGVMPFLLELFHSTGDEAYLDAARAGADHIASDLEGIQGNGLYEGLAGAAFVLEETFRASGDRTYRDHAARATELLMRRAVPLGDGMAWPVELEGGGLRESNDIVSGTAGIALTLLYLADRMGHTAAVETARRAGYRLLDNRIQEPAGLRWDIYDGYAREMPNFSHGTAGIAYALASIAGPASEPAFLGAAQSGADYLTSIATVADDGYLIRHNSPEGMDLFYLSWCHGPVGTNRLFHRLHELTGDSTWEAWVTRGAQGIMGTGVPEERTDGFWENVSQCCGSAGLADYFLTLHRMTGVPEYRAFVDRVNDDLLVRSTPVSDGRMWVQSEHRVLPDLLVAQTGYMQGAGGIGKYYLHLHAMEERGAAPTVLLPDAPY